MQPPESNQHTAVNSRQTLQGTDMDIKELALKVAEEVYGAPIDSGAAEQFCDFATRFLAAYLKEQGNDESQNWKGMSGAVAWHLIDRHGEDWADIGNKMDAWLKANTAPPLPATPALTEIFMVTNRTSFVAFATAEQAHKYIASFSGSIGGGMSVSSVPVIAAGEVKP